ncbi:MAG: UvrD-helicase domain-containing protein [Chlamydiales bacterium]|nr:UvrD-helicase domain-containing protein [Chlamydiales bacterium]
MDAELNKLNSEQQRAVFTTDGKVLVLAGAGSGKTRVLTVRIAHLIRNCNVSPSSILGLTFTNKAAAEMRERVGHLLGDRAAKEITLCTFHSFCMNILRKEIEAIGYTKHFSLYDEYDVQRLVKQIARELLEHNSDLPSLAPTLLAIHQARNNGLEPEEISCGTTWHDSFFKELYKDFKSSMRSYNAVDFDDLLSLTLRLFKEHPSILHRYQERFSHILIDEYQDTNKIQYQITSLLSQKHQNLCVVGDDDQSIYGWRGAEIKHILEFDHTKLIKLEQNYRSTNVILKAANALIRNNKERHSKELWSSKESDRLIEVFHAPTDIQEAESVVCRLVKLKLEKGLKWKDIAILYRSNALARAFEQALLKHTWKDGDKWIRGVPYQVFGGEEYYERKEVKDLIAYLRVLLNPMDQEALLRIINLPRRGIGADSLEKLTQFNRSCHISLWNTLENLGTTLELEKVVPEKAKESIKAFIQLIYLARKEFQSKPLSEAMRWLIETIDFKKSIYEDVKSDTMRQFKLDNVEAFVNSLASYESEMKEMGRDQEISLHDFVTSTPLGQEKSFQKQKSLKEDCVALMTFHSAKGLEFEACFLVAIEDNIIPHEKSLRETGIEEERRLMYVAITRAKHYLTCSMARNRSQMGKDMPTIPSRFLSEIPKELLLPTLWNTL